MFCILAHGYCLVLLGTIAYLGTSLAIINEKCMNPLEQWADDCIDRGKSGISLFYCENEGAGIIRQDGQIDTARFRELILPYILTGKEQVADMMMNVALECLEKEGPVNSLAETETAFGKCDTMFPAIQELEAVLCRPNDTTTQ